MNISLSNETTSIFKGGKPAFLQNNVIGTAKPFKPNETTQSLVDLVNGKLDQAAISDEAKQLLSKLKEAKEVEATDTQANAKEEVKSFLGLAKQSLQDLSKDIDDQLKNVDILESETATAEEKSAARENLAYIESTANLRGGIFSEKLLDKIVPNASQAVTAAYEQAKGASSDIQAMEAAGDKLLVTNAKTLGLEGIAEKSPVEMREILTAAKEKVLQKASAMDAVTTSFSQLDTKLELHKREASVEKTDKSVNEMIAKEMEQSGLEALLVQANAQKASK